MYMKFVKRIFDIVFSIIGLFGVAVIFIPISLLIYFEDKGPILYNAPRMGKNGKIFKMYKLRSMKVNAPDIRLEDGSTYNSKDDPRVTRVGKFIRKTSIDELPQIINVLIGEMSFIGPRPDLPEDIKAYSSDEIRKLSVRPGISGYSQAYFRNSIGAKEKHRNDVFYVDHVTFWLDTKIFFVTIINILLNKNVFVQENVVNIVETTSNSDTQ